jgi:CheY-like chemotaxis protein
VRRFILLVESDADQRATITDYLTGMLPSVVVTSTSSSAEALERVRTARFELIITAHVLQPFSGIELIRRIRALGLTVPIVMHTSDDTIETAALAAGASRFLVKNALAHLLRVVKALQAARPA